MFVEWNAEQTTESGSCETYGPNKVVLTVTCDSDAEELAEWT
jgi:hypothetical protein